MNTTKLFACRTLEHEVNAVLPAHVDCEFLEYALHNTPDKLRTQLQQKINEADGYDTLLLGYGLCSNSLAGLNSSRHTLVVPRVHDCISLLMGSREKYQQEFAGAPGTYYLSQGWLEQDGDPLSSFHRYCDKYGEDNARFIIETEYTHYKRLVYIHTAGRIEADLERCRKVAEFLGIEFIEMNGALTMFEKLVNGDWDKDFVVTRPGRMVAASSFM